MVADPLNVDDFPRQDTARCSATSSNASPVIAPMAVRPQLDCADQEYLQGVQCRPANQLAEAHQTLRTCDRSAAQSRAGPQQYRCHSTGARRSHVGRERLSKGDRIGSAVRPGLVQSGQLLSRGKSPERGDHRLSPALALMPTDAETRINLATVLRELRRFDESLALLAAIPLTSSQWPKAEFNRSLVTFPPGGIETGLGCVRGETANRVSYAGNFRTSLEGCANQGTVDPAPGRARHWRSGDVRIVSARRLATDRKLLGRMRRPVGFPVCTFVSPAHGARKNARIGSGRSSRPL